ncbi:MAG: S46 family peptidase [Elusimicrobiota bacterium]|jgi:hypothetical protein
MKATLEKAPALSDFPLLQDEGMWTFDNPPRELLRRHYGFTPNADWLKRVRLASLRFNDGGSGSFVSKDGLVLTNHHVALGQLQKMSSAKKDFVKDGFFAKSRAAERPCPDLEINQLVSMEEVTARVLAAIDPKASEKRQNEQRKAETARLEKESLETTGLRSDVVELYQGGEYWLYRSKKHTDVRLVMAPELGAAFFGGDHDNFTYPRFALDFAFFRVYEGGKPVRPESFFPFGARGLKEGQLCFVTGHPGSTDRLYTVAQLRHQRDAALPMRIAMLKRRRDAALRHGSSPERLRRSQDFRFGVENALKALTGELEGLRDPSIFHAKEAAERSLRTRVETDPALAESAGAWDRVEGAVAELSARYKGLVYRRLTAYRLTSYAEHAVRMTAEVEKPNGERLEEYRDSALESLRFRLFSPAPVYADFEEALLADSLRESLEALGPADPFLKDVLAGKTPEAAAREALRGTRMPDPAFRRTLVEGGRRAVESSKDPLLALCRRADPHYRSMRKWYEDNIQSVERHEGNRIARARFAVYGKGLYPDATFTLRLSYGQPVGYECGKTLVPWKTTFGGLYDRADSFDGREPFGLSRRVAAARRKVRMDCPVNFVSTHDIIGGNSGSPVIDAKAELVGLIFDGNIQSLPGRYAYARERARAVSVHSEAILESLRAVYGMNGLARELVRR